MSPDQAAVVRRFLTPQIAEERETTRRILAAVPRDREDFRPHSDARSALELAWHIVNVQIWFLDAVIHGAFAPEPDRMPCSIHCVADVLVWEEKNVPALIAEVEALAPDRLVCEMEGPGRSMRPAVAYLTVLLMHVAHHRGQFAAYLRAMGARVPSIYGGSADEPFEVALS